MVNVPKWASLLAVPLFFAMLWLSPAAWALSCHGSLVDTGDRAYEILDKCGQPSYRDHYREPLVPGLRTTVELRVWYYNFGPQRLIDILYFRNGVLRRIANSGYGFNTPLDGRCEPETIDVGMTKYELLARCGQPRAKHDLLQYRPLRLGTEPQPGPFVVARVELWTYTFSSNRFARDVRLINGIVKRVDIAP